MYFFQHLASYRQKLFAKSKNIYTFVAKNNKY